MFVRFVLVLVLVFGCAVFNGYASGGRIASLVEPVVLAGMTGMFLCLVFLCGYGKSWRILFSSSKGLSTFSLSRLKEGEAALDVSARILLYVSVFFALVGIMYYFLNLQNTSSLGPNLAVVLYSLLYLCFFQLVIFTMKGALRRGVILYMAEDAEEGCAAKSEEESFGRILKPIFFSARFFFWRFWRSRFLSGGRNGTMRSIQRAS